MTDNKDEVPLDNPTNNKTEDSPDETTSIADTETIKPIQETEIMEVHHHAHDPAAPHHKKNWKSYFWEFLMLFLAVFCGFLAEWQLEHVIEHSREKEFISSMIEDAQIDSANINVVLKQTKKQLLCMDSLTTACYNYEFGKTNDYDIYCYYREILSTAETLKPTERTLVQLKNSGGMRLIRKKIAADIIINYDGLGKDAVAQNVVIAQIFQNSLNISYELFNMNFYRQNNYIGVSKTALLLNHDKEKLVQFANRMTTIGAGTLVFYYQLEKMNKEAVKLINVLRKEYHLTD